LNSEIFSKDEKRKVVSILVPRISLRACKDLGWSDEQIDRVIGTQYSHDIEELYENVVKNA
jgi:hypothetical protein